MVAPSATSKARIFVSYSRKDSDFAHRLVAALAVRGFEAMLDTKDIAPGEDWQARLGKLILAADTVIFLVSPDSVGSQICAWEAAEAERLHKRILPVECRETRELSLIPVLAKLNFVSFADERAFETQADLLAVAIDADLDWIREHTRLADMAHRWKSTRLRAAELLRGKALTEAEEWISHQPRSAPAPTAWHREFISASRKAETSRSRRIVAGALIAMLLAIGLASWATLQRNEAQRQTQLATANFELATFAADAIVADVAQGLQITGISQDVVRKVLNSGEKVVDRLVKDGKYNAQLRMIQTRLYSEYSKTYWYVGDVTSSRKSLERSLGIIESLLQADQDNVELLNRKSDNLHRLGDILRQQGEMDSALEIFRNAKKVRQRLVELQPQSGDAWRQLAFIHDRLGDTMRADRRFNEAASEYAVAEKIRMDFLKRKPDDDDWLYDLTWSHNRIGDNLLGVADHHSLMIGDFQAENDDDQSKAAEAFGAYQKGLAIRQRLVKKDATNSQWHRDLAWSRNLVGMAQRRAGDAAGALANHRAAIYELTLLLVTDPKNTESLRYKSLAHTFLGDALLKQGDRKAAFEEYEQGLKIRESLAGLDPQNPRWLRDLFHTRRRLFELHRAAGHEDVAQRYRASALQIAEQVRGAFPSDREVLLAIPDLERRAHM